jgi:hypothetical protein
MKYKFEIEVFADHEPVYCIRAAGLHGEKQTAAHNPKSLGRALLKLLERIKENEAAKQTGDNAAGAA